MERPIVYSARYYYPPTDNRLSQYHLYRCNPDGTRRMQLTKSKVGDYRPLWSPDGKRVLFRRIQTDRVDSLTFASVLHTDLCLIRPDGSDFRTIRLPNPKSVVLEVKWHDNHHIWVLFYKGYNVQEQLCLFNIHTSKLLFSVTTSPDGEERHFAVSPDKKHLVLGKRIFDIATGKVIANLPKELTSMDSLSVFWLDNRNLITLTDTENQSKDGNFDLVVQCIALGSSSTTTLASVPITDRAFGYYLFAWGDIKKKTVWITEHAKDKWYYRRFWKVNLETKKYHAYEDALGWQPAFSPDGTQFIGPGDRDATPYGTRPNGAPRAVMTVPLLGGDVDNKAKTFSRGWVEVDSCDWRR
jgi:hypothetical protein